MAALFRPQGERCHVLIESGAFSSDRHVVTSQLRWHGLEAAVQLGDALGGIEDQEVPEPTSRREDGAGAVDVNQAEWTPVRSATRRPIGVLLVDPVWQQAFRSRFGVIRGDDLDETTHASVVRVVATLEEPFSVRLEECGVKAEQVGACAARPSSSMSGLVARPQRKRLLHRGRAELA